MKYLTLFHANLNYAYLEPHKYEQVIRASYEVIIDTFRDKCPDSKYIFEASGFTIDEMAKRTPDVLKKLRKAIASGQCEFMGAPYAHPLLANNPEEDGRWSNEFSMRAYEKHLGFRPESAWNPECTWMQYVPNTFKDVGYKYLTLDLESYKNSTDKEYSWVERNRARDISWGGHLPWYPLDPDDKALHFPFKNIVPGLGGFCRSDRLAGKSIGYFLDRLPIKDYIENVKYWSGKKKKGALMIIADDAEYCGTTGYFFIKHYGDYSRSFTVDPNASKKLETLVHAVEKIGELVTFKEACELPENKDPFFVEDRFAWHRTYADVWAKTPESLYFDPIVANIRNDYKNSIQQAAESRKDLKPIVEKFWFHLTNSQNSDGRWPPPPEIVCPFNRKWVETEVSAAQKTLNLLKKKVGKVKAKLTDNPNRNKLSTDRYNYVYTRKKTTDVSQLSWYELQHYLYSSFRLYDHKDKVVGKKAITDIFKSYEKRGIKTYVKPDVLKKK